MSNRLLSRLSEHDYAALAPDLSPVHLHRKDVLGERGGPVTHVHFPAGSVLSVLAFMESGTAVEVGTIGYEGFHGLEALFDAECWSETTVCQVEGDGMRMPVARFREACASSATLLRQAQRYLLAYMSLVSRSVACNRLHNIEERFARWVLMTHDRVEGDDFFLTQEFIADMLGVHRPSVSLVAGAFQRAGFIKYMRGQMSILDREALEQASCECYAASAADFAVLLK